MQDGGLTVVDHDRFRTAPKYSRHAVAGQKVFLTLSERELDVEMRCSRHAQRTTTAGASNRCRYNPAANRLHAFGGSKLEVRKAPEAWGEPGGRNPDDGVATFEAWLAAAATLAGA